MTFFTAIKNQGLSVFLSAIVCLAISNQLQAAEDTICAVVKIEIVQELTFERQGFEAIMKINNALEDRSLTNIGVEVHFNDANGDPVVASSDPNHPDASFFIRITQLEGIDDVAGTGELLASTSATINWLIVPVPGASGNIASGNLYYVGATFSYTLNDIDEEMVVAPDIIFVKPMPELTLDYFLPSDVYADDPLTNEIEPIVPFTLGVRVRNNGSATAKSVKIDSAQPKIVENTQGLLINFEITDSFINEQAVNNSLLLDFGDIDSNSSATGRWIMQTTLSGRFTEFDASFSHADDLGGQLTSLIDAVNAHLLIHDVRVNLPGRDGVRDFLVKNGAAYTVFESDSIDTPVNNLSASASFSPLSSSQYQLTFTGEPGAAYVTLPDLFDGEKIIVQAVRSSDGAVLDSANVWQSKTYNKTLKQWVHSFHLFDTNTTGSYVIDFEVPVIGPSAPVLQYIQDWSGVEGGQIGFLIEASDVNGDNIAFSVNPMPVGATITEVSPGKVRFNWLISPGQVGSYPITVSASDGSLYANKQVMLRVFNTNDTDGDGLDDAWEILHFGDLSRDGTGDFDGDGISDLDEFLQGSDPTVEDGPQAPVIISPNQQTVSAGDIELIAQNSVYLGGNTLSYFFELYSDIEKSQLVLASDEVSEQQDQTAWLVEINLNENTDYYWRVRSYNGSLYSLWSDASFFLNSVNESPSAAVISSPVSGTEVDVLTPILRVLNATDPDGDTLQYRFAVYFDDALTLPVIDSGFLFADESGETPWQLTQALDEGGIYYWQVSTKDPAGLTQLSDVAWFSVYRLNQLPTTPTIISPILDAVINDINVDVIVTSSTDADGDSLSYYFELDTVNSFDSTNLMTESVSTAGEQVVWSLYDLQDSTSYFWRVRAEDAQGGYSATVNGRFSVNISQQAPNAPVINNPGDGAWVESLTPTLSVYPVTDSDRPVVSYEFEIYSDEAQETLVNTAEVASENYTVSSPLSDNSWYYWRVRAIDDADVASPWSSYAKFFVNDQGNNEAPEFSWVTDNSYLNVSPGSKVTLNWTDNDPDSNAEISFTYLRTPDAEVIDDIGSSFSTSTSDWRVDNLGLPGSEYHINSLVGSMTSATWAIDLTESALYEVQLYTPELNIPLLDSVQYLFNVKGSGTTSTVPFKEAPGSIKNIKGYITPIPGWVSFGEHELLSGEFSFTYTGFGSGGDKALVADKIRLIPKDGTDQIITSGILEDGDGSNDSYLWDTTGLAQGKYRVIAEIKDESSSVKVYSILVVEIGSSGNPEF